MYVSARTDYAVRAMLSVTAEHPRLVKAASLAAAQEIQLSFLQGILLDLRRAGLLHSHRGVDGGYALARPADRITVGDGSSTVNGGMGNDTIMAGNGDNSLLGGAGADSITAGNGNNTVVGGLDSTDGADVRGALWLRQSG